MRRYWLTGGVIAGSILALFLVVELLEVPILVDPAPWMAERGAAAAAVGVGLLLVDVLLPVPSSFVMLAHGALFGLWAGAALSLVGSTGAALVAFAIGRAGGPLLTRLVGAEERQRADRLLARWGVLAIAITRPIPVLAETTAILAGASPLGWTRALWAAAAGSVVPALAYALAGAMAASHATGALVFAGVVVVSSLLWWAGRHREPRASAVQGR